MLASVDDVLEEYEEPRQVDAIGGASTNASAISAALVVRQELTGVVLFADTTDLLFFDLFFSVMSFVSLVSSIEAMRSGLIFSTSE